MNISPFTTRFDFLDACPWCGHPIDAASDFESQARPKVGDAAVCLRCGQPGVYGPDMRLRRPEPGELESCPEQFATVLEYAARVAEVNRRQVRASLPRVRNRVRDRRRP